MNTVQKQQALNGLTAILKGIVRGAAKSGSSKRSTARPASQTRSAAKAPCGTCGGAKK